MKRLAILAVLLAGCASSTDVKDQSAVYKGTFSGSLTQSVTASSSNGSSVCTNVFALSGDLTLTLTEAATAQTSAVGTLDVNGTMHNTATSGGSCNSLGDGPLVYTIKTDGPGSSFGGTVNKVDGNFTNTASFTGVLGATAVVGTLSFSTSGGSGNGSTSITRSSTSAPIQVTLQAVLK